ncbi:molybdopterin-dependent oxidoreductase [Nocardioides sp.]|uniref:molybdopterin-dependent oxidoreductase n=1 Tax=Nocardioides sp. TaxID=35761 RepID=UPI0026242D2E|nr:molybdopterin-dependent oxidoreductase [Nocardioides sp.]
MSPTLRGRLTWAGFGLLSTLTGTAAGHFVASLDDVDTSPVLAVGSAVIDLTPTPVKEWAIAQFGTADKPILIGSVMAGVLVLAAVAGLVARRRLALGAAIEAVLVAVAGTAVMTQPRSEVLDLVPTLATAVVGIGSLLLLARIHARSAHGADGTVGTASTDGADTPAATGPEQSSAKRRTVLVAAGVLAVAATALASAGQLIRSIRARPEDVTLPAPTDPAGSFPQGLESQVDGITPLRIANEDFYRVDTRLDTPVVDLESWTLTIDGDVEREVVLTFDDLLEMDLIERDITLTCVSNSVGGEFVGGARWLGVRLTDILDLAGVGPDADQIFSTDFDGMTISTPLDLATDGRDAMIAIGMNGEALPRANGFPARMIVPGLYGFISATKWITRITLTTYAEKEAYWTERDWATDAPIKISTRIDTISALDQLDAGEVLVGGVAWAQQRGGVATVQVQIDGGAWEDAEMGPDVGNDYWRQWFYRWDARPGSHNVAARAISGDGETQTAVRAVPFPEGSSGIQSLQVTVS